MSTLTFKFNKQWEAEFNFCCDMNVSLNKKVDLII